MRLPALLLFSSLYSLLHSQCPTSGSWQAIGPWSAPGGPVHAIVAWDPDGPGPLGQHYVFGGAFGYAGNVACQNLALFDPQTRDWLAVLGDVDGPVHSLLVTANNDLVIGGEFTAIGTVPAQNVARWAAGTWQALSTGTDGLVAATVELPSGDLVLGGDFTNAGGIACSNVARWDGQGFHALGTGVGGPPNQQPVPPLPPVHAIGVRGNDVIVAGQFGQAGALFANGVARWDGAAWHAIGYPFGDLIGDMIVLGNNEVVVGARDANGLGAVRRWDGVSWSTVGIAPLPFTALLETSSGSIVGSGLSVFSALGEAYEWDGTSWLPLTFNHNSPTFGRATAIVEHAPDEYLLGNQPWSIWTSAVWLRGGGIEALGPGLDGAIHELAAHGDRFIAGGYFSQVGSVPSPGIAVYDNGSWQPMGSGFESVGDFLVTANDEIVAIGTVLDPNGVPGRVVAEWNGSQWQPLPQVQPNFWPARIAEAPNGDLLVVDNGGLGVARWDGTAWTMVAAPSPLGFHTDLVVLPNGEIVISVSQPTTATLVQRWTGTAWSRFPMGPNATQLGIVNKLLVDAQGKLWCGGSFALGTGMQPHGLACWDGQSWTADPLFDNQTVTDIDELPNGDLLVARSDVNGGISPVLRAGASASISGFAVAAGSYIDQLAINDAGEAVAFGTFETIQGIVAGGLARFATPCTATQSNAGGGCAGAAGPVEMAIEQRAWLGGTFTSRTSGVPANAIAVPVYGLASASLPLQNVLPQAVPGCTLHVSPDVVLLALPNLGEVTSQWTLPSSTALLAQTFRHQIIVAELGANGSIAAVTSSNAHALSVGAW